MEKNPEEDDDVYPLLQSKPVGKFNSKLEIKFRNKLELKFHKYMILEKKEGKADGFILTTSQGQKYYAKTPLKNKFLPEITELFYYKLLQELGYGAEVDFLQDEDGSVLILSKDLNGNNKNLVLLSEKNEINALKKQMNDEGKQDLRMLNQLRKIIPVRDVLHNERNSGFQLEKSKEEIIMKPKIIDVQPDCNFEISGCFQDAELQDEKRPNSKCGIFSWSKDSKLKLQNEEEKSKIKEEKEALKKLIYGDKSKNIPSLSEAVVRSNNFIKNKLNFDQAKNQEYEKYLKRCNENIKYYKNKLRYNNFNKFAWNLNPSITRMPNFKVTVRNPRLEGQLIYKKTHYGNKFIPKPHLVKTPPKGYGCGGEKQFV